ncbi:c-type cytochrome [Marinicellulosiphila megalodicopiae]|uniref:c-type cytochrome n=1 Tax=Marinicellulosiphila megalodicopiae TaxID=2724896 RepID=UPI003BAF2882
MIKTISAFTISAVTSVLLLSSCVDEFEAQVEEIARGQEVFENYCADCHDLGEENGKFYLGVTYHLSDLEEYIQTDMPYNEADDCDAQCASDVAAYIQDQMCTGEEDLTLCDENGKTGTATITNSEIGAKIARGSVEFKYVCSDCHATPNSNEVKNGPDLFAANAPFFSGEGMKTYITANMPKPFAEFQQYAPEDCDATCADEVTLYLQSEYCDSNPEYAFCADYDKTLYTGK